MASEISPMVAHIRPTTSLRLSSSTGSLMVMVSRNSCMVTSILMVMATHFIPHIETVTMIAKISHTDILLCIEHFSLLYTCTYPRMSSVCPFAKAASSDAVCPAKVERNKVEKETEVSVTVAPKCPFGYDSHTFKLGPLSCLICQALLFESSKCLPCSHKYCKTCISRFSDCPLCGAGIEKIEPDDDLQEVVDRFIEGHARIKRSQVNTDMKEVDGQQNNVIYEDVSLERGSFLVQQAMRAFRAQNIGSAKSRLSLCAEDIRVQLERSGNTSELCSQLGAVLGMLGDCCRAMGDGGSAVTYYIESVEFLSKLPVTDLEVVHTLSVSLNKIGDLKYYDGDLSAARSYYYQSLDVRRNAAEGHPDLSSQVIDVATSLAKVADVDLNLGNKDIAIGEFEEAIKCLESLSLDSNEAGLEKRRLSVLEFVRSQLVENQKSPPAAAAV